MLAATELVPGAQAQQPADWGRDPARFLSWVVSDGEALLEGAASPRALYVVGAGGMLFTAARGDQLITDKAGETPLAGVQPAIFIFNEIGNSKAIQPLAVGIFLGSLLTDDTRFQDAAFTSLEAVVLANGLTNALKLVVGRARPFQDEGPLHFAPFSGNTSFPSGHATTAFAVVTPWLLYYPNYLTPGLLILGATTAFSRLATDMHWFTDVLAGSAVGFGTAYWLSRRHQPEGGDLVVVPVLSLNKVGVVLRLP